MKTEDVEELRELVQAATLKSAKLSYVLEKDGTDPLDTFLVWTIGQAISKQALLKSNNSVTQTELDRLEKIIGDMMADTAKRAVELFNKMSQQEKEALQARHVARFSTEKPNPSDVVH